MNATGRQLTDFCTPLQNYSAVYVRKARRQSFARLPHASSRLSTHHWIRNALRWPMSVGLALFMAATTNQAVSATRHEALPVQDGKQANERRASLGQLAWTRYLETGLHCRSTIDGSNPDFVQKVKARMFGAAGFSHIVTTLWPRTGDDYELTMMFRVGTEPGNGKVREARASVDPETCRARLLSIS